MSFVSYAQNFEDVMLWRALQHVQDGFYVDVGAHDPIVDSVSQAFHERGWRGVHVEPVAKYADMLRAARPGDPVVQAALGNSTPLLKLHELEGLSTVEPGVAAMHRERGIIANETTVPSVPLSAVLNWCGAREIHWLKIDVEGLEEPVLQSWGEAPHRPWIVVVESTVPMSREESHTKWDWHLHGRGYECVYFDGLNRYYLWELHKELREAFRAPPNVFDDFALHGSSSAPFHRLIETRHHAEIATLRTDAERELAAASGELAATGQRLAEAESQAATRQQELHGQLADTRHRLDAALEEFARAEHARAEEARQRTEEALQRADEYRQLESRLGAEREQLAARHAEGERMLLAQLDRGASALQGSLEQLHGARTDLARAMDRASQREQDHLREVASLRGQAERDRAWLDADHQQRLQATRHELGLREQELQQQLRHAEASRGQLEGSLGEAFAALQQSQAACAAAREEVQQLQAGLTREQAQASLLGAQVASLQADIAHKGHLLRRVAAWLRQDHRHGNASWRRDADRHQARLATELEEAGQPVLAHAPMNHDSPLPPSAAPVAAATLQELLRLQGRHFVATAYQLVLGRPADDTGFAYYLQRLRDGIPKIHILRELRQSEEGVRAARALAGLDEALHRQARGERRWTGWLYRFGVEGTSASDQRLRVLEQALFELREQTDRDRDAAQAAWQRLDDSQGRLLAAAADVAREAATLATAERAAQPPAPVPAAMPAGTDAPPVPPEQPSMVDQPLRLAQAPASAVLAQLAADVSRTREAQQLSRNP